MIFQVTIIENEFFFFFGRLNICHSSIFVFFFFILKLEMLLEGGMGDAAVSA